MVEEYKNLMKKKYKKSFNYIFSKKKKKMHFMLYCHSPSCKNKIIHQSLCLINYRLIKQSKCESPTDKHNMKIKFKRRKPQLGTPLLEARCRCKCDCHQTFVDQIYFPNTQSNNENDENENISLTNRNKNK